MLLNHGIFGRKSAHLGESLLKVPILIDLVLELGQLPIVSGLLVDHFSNLASGHISFRLKEHGSQLVLYQAVWDFLQIIYILLYQLIIFAFHFLIQPLLVHC